VTPDSRIACSIESIRMCTAPSSRANSRAIVVFPSPGKPPRTRSIGRQCIASYVSCRCGGSSISLRPDRRANRMQVTNAWSTAILEIRRPNASSCRLDRDDAAIQQRRAVALKSNNASVSLVIRSDIYQPNDSAVRDAANDCQLAKIFVERHDNCSMSCGVCQNRGVAGIGGPICDVLDLVALLQKDRLCSRRHAGVKDDLHEASGRTASSTRSWPTTRRAYSKQARTSAASNHGYSARSVSDVSPAASMPRTCSTASRRPLMIGLPPKISGFTVMRARSSRSVLAIASCYATSRLESSRIRTSGRRLRSRTRGNHPRTLLTTRPDFTVGQSSIVQRQPHACMVGRSSCFSAYAQASSPQWPPASPAWRRIGPARTTARLRIPWKGDAWCLSRFDVRDGAAAFCVP
jgi:hypothetical protein